MKKINHLNKPSKKNQFKKLNKKQINNLIKEYGITIDSTNKKEYNELTSLMWHNLQSNHTSNTM